MPVLVDVLTQAIRRRGKVVRQTEKARLVFDVDALPSDQRSALVLRELNGLSYSELMHGLKANGVEVDRKVLGDLAVFDKPAFGKFVEQAKANLGA